MLRMLAYHWLKSLKESRHKNPIKEQQNLKCQENFSFQIIVALWIDPSTDDFIDINNIA